MVQKVKFEILKGCLSPLNCPITTDFPDDPVLTNCGHIFDRVFIQEWLRQSGQSQPCAVCKTTVIGLTPIYALREFAENRLPKDLVLTCSNFKGLNQQRAAQCFEIARNCIDEKDYEGALGFLAQALQYTNSSVDYAVIPGLYDQMGTPEKALLSRLHLSLYQLQEGKIQEAIETLTHCQSDTLDLSFLIVGLTLQFCQSSENVERAMTCALNQSPEDRIFIYKQIVAHVPTQFDAYKAAVQQLNLAPPKPSLPSIAFGKDQWALYFGDIGTEPPLPPNIEEILNAPCPFWPDKKVKETHLLTLIPATVNGKPLTLKTLGELIKSPKQGTATKYRSFYPGEYKDEGTPQSHWVLMGRDVLPGTRSKSYAEQQKVLSSYKDKGGAPYEAPLLLDATVSILMEHVRSGTRLFSNNPWTYTRCQEKWDKGLSDGCWGLRSFWPLISYNDGKWRRPCPFSEVLIGPCIWF